MTATLNIAEAASIAIHAMAVLTKHPHGLTAVTEISKTIGANHE